MRCLIEFRCFDAAAACLVRVTRPVPLRDAVVVPPVRLLFFMLRPARFLEIVDQDGREVGRLGPPSVSTSTAYFFIIFLFFIGLPLRSYAFEISSGLRLHTRLGRTTLDCASRMVVAPSSEFEDVICQARRIRVDNVSALRLRV